MENNNRRYILAIESAISGGSIAILDGSAVLAESSGSALVSRAEHLLPAVIEILDKAGLTKHDIQRVAVSLGPGSYTGLRIGISTVMGLCKGLDISYVGVPVLEAVALGFSNENALITLPFGRGDICLSSTRSPDRPEIIHLDELTRTIASMNGVTLLAHSDLVPTVAKLGIEYTDIGSNLARFVGLSALELPASNVLDPIYVQNPRFR